VFHVWSRCISVSIETRLGLNDQDSVLGGDNDGILSPRHCLQTGPGAHPSSYPLVTGVSSPVVNRPGHEADHISISC